MDPTYDSDPFPVDIPKRKVGFWYRLGGGPLTIAIIIHLIVLIIGAFWIFQRIREPDKKVDFMPPGGGGGERGAEHQVNQKKQKQITPNTNVKRVFAEGAQATFTIPDQSDTFGEMASLTSLSGGGATGGLGGSGLGKGFGKGIGGGAGLGTGGGIGKLFGQAQDGALVLTTIGRGRSSHTYQRNVALAHCLPRLRGDAGPTAGRDLLHQFDHAT